MTPYRKKLIEVALPLEAINEASAAEKKIHVGTTSNLHAWWARRPLAACRAAIFASLVDDPSNDLLPDAAERRRAQLFDLIRRLVSWEANNDMRLLAEVRKELEMAVGGCRVVVADPFCGSGSIPVEAQRLGVEALGNDLNPVAVAISKAVVEVPPAVAGHSPIRPGNAFDMPGGHSGFSGFQEDLRYYSERVLARARQVAVGLYASSIKAGARPPIAWLWCRTVPCSNPACRIRIPLMKSYWLSQVPTARSWMDVDGVSDKGRVLFKIRDGAVGGPRDATITATGACCVACGTPMAFSGIRSAAMRGELGFQMTAVVEKCGTKMLFRAATEMEEAQALACSPDWAPDTELPTEGLGFRVQNYGLSRHRDLFLPRQLAVLSLFRTALRETLAEVTSAASADPAYGKALSVYLGIFFDRLVQTNNALVRWFTHTLRPSKAQPTFDKQTVQMVWDFAESNPLADSAGGWTICCRYPQTALDCLPRMPAPGRILHGDARSLVAVPGTEVVFCTDPPYFNNIGYADLSDFFYIWLRQVMKEVYPEVFDTILVPKSEELIVDTARHGGNQNSAETYFYDGMSQVFRRLWELASDHFPATVFYAFKQSESGASGATASTGWEHMLQALLDTKWSVVGTWPIRTEHENRPRGIGANALASSILLVCRKRHDDAGMIDRSEFRRTLRLELPEALRLLQMGNIAPVDMAQASIGPGMAIFSRHAKVLESDGTPMTVRTALQLINQALDEYLTEQEGEFDGDTRFAITWFETRMFDSGAFGEAETLAKARNVSVAGVVDAGFLQAGAGKVRLLKRDELPDDWDPAKDKRLTVWEATQHLIKRLETKGEQGAAEMLVALGSRAAPARDLAYRLYTTCERKGWAEEARAYNGLVIAWPELEKLAVQVGVKKPTTGKLL